MKTTFRAYRETDQTTSLYSEASERQARSTGLLRDSATFLWEIEAHTPEEASAIYNLRMGFEPYKPVGASAPCPSCGRLFYPAGSGVCWCCGQIT